MSGKSYILAAKALATLLIALAYLNLVSLSDEVRRTARVDRARRSIAAIACADIISGNITATRQVLEQSYRSDVRRALQFLPLGSAREGLDGTLTVSRVLQGPDGQADPRRLFIAQFESPERPFGAPATILWSKRLPWRLEAASVNSSSTREKALDVVGAKLDLRTIAEKLQLSADKKDDYSIFREVESRLVDRPIQISGLGLEFTPDTLFWALAVIGFAFLILIRNALRCALVDPKTGSDEPWIVLDAQSGFEFFLAGTWFLGLLASPWISSFGLVHSTACRLQADGPVSSLWADVAAFVLMLVLTACQLWVSLTLASLMIRLRELRAARIGLEERLFRLQTVGDARGEARSRIEIAEAALERGDNESAKTQFTAALPLCHQLQDVVAEAQCRQRLAWIATIASDDAATETHTAAAITLYQRLGDTAKEAESLLQLARVASRQDNLHSVMCYRRAIRLFEELEAPARLATCQFELSRVLPEEDSVEAETLVKESLKKPVHLDEFQELQARILRTRLLLERGKRHAARRHAKRAQVLARALDDRLAEGQCALLLADCDPAQSHSHLERAHRLLVGQADRTSEARCMIELAKHLAPTLARQLYLQALPTVRSLGLRKLEIQCLLGLARVDALRQRVHLGEARELLEPEMTDQRLEWAMLSVVSSLPGSEERKAALTACLLVLDEMESSRARTDQMARTLAELVGLSLTGARWTEAEDLLVELAKAAEGGPPDLIRAYHRLHERLRETRPQLPVPPAPRLEHSTSGDDPPTR